MDGMTLGEGRSRSVAAALMRMAPVLLDRDGDLLAAARLQHALDTLERVGPVGGAEDEESSRSG